MTLLETKKIGEYVFNVYHDLDGVPFVDKFSDEEEILAHTNFHRRGLESYTVVKHEICVCCNQAKEEFIDSLSGVWTESPEGAIKYFEGYYS